ncbi:MAG: GMP synthase (glutamine-hydrolyzing), partial [Patescibacteria group bacterium]
NVGGLPKKLNFKLIEPLRNLYKDEVRQVGKVLGLPDRVIQRQPFPGPGLAVRIIGEVTEYKLKILRNADSIMREELEKTSDYKNIWQSLAVFTGIRSTGVRGDNRAYGETIALRIISAKDAMSAHWTHVPYETLDTISVRIVNEIPEVNRVVYDITNKPPATIEWE